MQTDESVKVIKRFYEALNLLISSKKIRGKKSFTDAYGIDRRNFLKLSNDNSRGLFQVAWLTFLVEDYGVSPEWLLTGRGNVFK